MRILINGEHEEISDGATVQQLVQKFKLVPKHVAVEVNRELVPRDTFPQTVLRDGDRVEIVTFVGGGST